MRCLLVAAGLLLLLSSAAASEPQAHIDAVAPNPAWDTLPVRLEGRGSNGPIVAWEWKSDLEGLLGNTSNVTAWLSAGEHNLTLRVQDQNGTWSASAWQLLSVRHNVVPWNISLAAAGVEVYRGNSLELTASADDDWAAAAALQPQFGYLLPQAHLERWSASSGGAVTVATLGGDHVAAASLDGKVRLYDTVLPEPLWEVSFDGGVRALAMASDATWLVAGGHDQRVTLLDGAGVEAWSWSTGQRVDVVAMSADGGWLAAGGVDSRVHLFNRSSGEPEWSFAAGDWVLSLAMSADGRYLAAGSADGRLYFFDRDSATPLWQTDIGSVRAVALSANGSWLAAGGGSSVHLFQRNSSTPAWSHATGGFAVRAVALSADGGRIVAGAEDGAIRFFHRNSSAPLWTATIGNVVPALALSSDGGWLAAGSDDDHIHFFSTSDGREAWSQLAGGALRSVAIAPDGEWVTGGGDGAQLLLLRRDGEAPLWERAAGDKVLAVALGGNTVASGSADGRLWLHDADGNLLWSHDAGDWVVAVGVSADGGQIVAGVEDGRVLGFTRDSGTPAWSYAAGDQLIALALAADGYRTAVGTADGSVRLLENGSLRWSYSAEGEIAALALSADGKWLAVGSWDESVYLFRSDSATPLWSFATDGVVTSVAIAPSGDWVASGGHGGVLRLFTRNASTPAWSYDFGSVIPAVALSGTEVAAGDGGGTVRLFTVDSATPLWSYAAGDAIRALALAGEGVAVATGGDEVLLLSGSGVVWRHLLDDRIEALALTGDYVAAGTRGDRIWLLQARPASLLGEPQFNTSWNVTLAPSLSAQPGDYRLRVRFADPHGALSAWYYLPGPVAVRNNPPQATIDSIAPSPADEGLPVFFGGSGSDVEGPITVWAWESSLDGAFGDEAQFSWAGLSQGLHTVTLRVSDSDGEWSLPATAQLLVNHRPVATILAPPGGVVQLGAAVEFSGSGWDDDGTIVAWEWASSLDGVFGTAAQFSHAGLAAGVHTLTLRVQDDSGVWSLPANVSLRVNAPPLVAIAYILPDPATAGEPVGMAAIGSDLDGAIASYEWISDRDGLLATVASFSTVGLSAGWHALTVRAVDGDEGWSATASATLFVNQPPQVMVMDLTPVLADEGAAVSFVGQGSDGDGNVTGYQWRSDLDGLLGTLPQFEATRLSVGVHAISLRVQDDLGAWSPAAELSLRVNALPVATLPGNIPELVGHNETLVITGNGSDADGEVVLYEWVSSLDGIISRNATLHANELTEGVHTLTLRVRDDSGGWSQPVSVIVKVIPAAAPPPEEVLPLWALLLGGLLVATTLATAWTLYAGQREEQPLCRLEEALLIYHDGRLLAHAGESRGDRELVGSLLTALMDFARDSFNDAGYLGAMEFGDSRVLIENGRHCFLATRVYGEATQETRNSIGETLEAVEARLAPVLARWDGDAELVAPARELLEQLLALTAATSRAEVDSQARQQRLRVVSDWSVQRGQLRFRVRVENHTSDAAPELELRPTVGALLRMDHIEPDLPRHDGALALGTLQPGEVADVALFYDPAGNGEAELSAELASSAGALRRTRLRTRRHVVPLPAPELVKAPNLPAADGQQKLGTLPARRKLRVMPAGEAVDTLATTRTRLERNELQLLDASARDVLYYGALRDGEGVLRLRVSGPRLEMEVAASDWETWLALAGLAMGSVKG